MRPLRSLLPADKRSQGYTVEIPQKRRKIALACEACRQRKSKCDGIRPACDNCTRYETVCQYTETETRSTKQLYKELKERETMLIDLIKSATIEETIEMFHRIQAGDTIEALVNQPNNRRSEPHLVSGARSAYEELYHILKNRPEEDLARILQLVRSGYNVDALVRLINDGDLLLQLSLVPECQLRYEFPYDKKWPDSLRQVENSYLDTLLYEPDELATGSISRASPGSIYGMPYHGAKLVESRLAQAKISRWTMVTSDESLLTQLVELYILHHHPFLPFFQKDLFLADLESGEEQFCSSLLVNAVLASATHYHRFMSGRNEPWNTQSLCYRFFAEAKRLWELELGESKLTTLQAALVMNSVYNMDGLDQIGNIYMVQAAKMAHNLNIFALSESNERTNMTLACQFTAWCLFSWQAMVLCHYYKPPLFTQPPRMHLPDPQKDPSFYGEIYIRYHRSGSPYPVNFPSAFYQTAKFRTVLNDLANDLFGGPQRRLSVHEAIKYYEQLMRWFQNLPVSLRPSNIVFPFQLQLHLHFQHVIMLLFEPFLALDSSATLVATSPGTNVTVKEIIMESKIRFETIIRLYYLRHSYTTYSPVMLQFLSVLGFAAISEAKNAQPSSSEGLGDLRSSILLAIQGLHHQGQAAHLSNTVFRLLYDELPIEAVNIANTYLSLKETDTDGQITSEYVRAAYPVNVVSIDADVEERRLNGLLQNLQTKSSDLNL